MTDFTTTLLDPLQLGASYDSRVYGTDDPILLEATDAELSAAVSNNYLEQLRTALHAYFDAQGGDPEEIALAKEQVDVAIDAGLQDVDPELQTAVDAQYGDENAVMVDSFMELLMEHFRAIEEEERRKEEGNSEGGDTRNAGGSEGFETGAANWYVLMVRALAEVQSDYLTLLNASYQKMQDSVGEGEDKQREFIAASAEVQAYAKLFGMASETTSTVTKTIGDGLTSILRKQ